jgi:Na+-transporting NADH:ubiquinone oxidoreductase subunit NqrC
MSLSSWSLSSWSPFSLHTTQIILTVIISSSITASIIFSTQQLQRETKVRQLKESIPKDHITQQLTEYGAAKVTTTEDGRNAQLAIKARLGDYDKGKYSQNWHR